METQLSIHSRFCEILSFILNAVSTKVNFSRLSEFGGGRIIGLKEVGPSFVEIANRINWMRSTVWNYWRVWSEE